MEVSHAQENKISFWQTARDSNWVDLALVVTALVVATIGAFAFIGWGSFNTIPYASIIGTSLLGTSAALLVGIIIYKAIACCKAPLKETHGSYSN